MREFDDRVRPDRTGLPQSPSSRLPRPPSTEPSSRRPAPLTPGDGLDDAIGQAAERQRLQPDVARARCSVAKNRPFAAEERGLHAADELDVVVDRRLQRDEAAGVDAQRLARLELAARAACRRRGRRRGRRRCRRCMMKPSPPNRPTPIFLWKAMPIETPLAAQRNESFWQISSPPSCLEVHRQDVAGVGRGEGDVLRCRRRCW